MTAPLGAPDREATAEAAAALPGLLVVGPRDLREPIAAALRCLANPRCLDPEQLVQRGRLVDAVGAFALLPAGADLRAVELLAHLRGLPAGRRLILITEELPEAILAAALDRLCPAAWLPHSAPAPVLINAVRALDLPAKPGKGARPQQRPASLLLGVSRALHEVMAQVKNVAPTRLPVLILGETGTGKELVARAIHSESDRHDQAFVAVNCGALPDSLLEAELFGHARGAFTGAERSRRGLFEEAHRGTLFLDEIGDTSPALQAKLLRALAAAEIRPLGGTEVVAVDVRVICATHRDLEAMVADGRFRRDLLYRINACTLFLPPLRRRRVDIPFLAQHFAEEFGEIHARRIILDDSFIDVLARADLPGNVRELRNRVERAIALAAPGEVLSARHVEGPGRAAAERDASRECDEEGSAPPTPIVRLEEEVESLERRLIGDALARCRGNRSQAARELGLSRQGLRNRMARYSIE